MAGMTEQTPAAEKIPKLPRFRVLTFDCYGTLIDWERGIVAALSGLRSLRASQALRSFRDSGGREDVEIADAALLEAFGRSEHEQERGEASSHKSGSFRPYPEILRAVFHDIAAEFGASNHEALTEDAGRFANSAGEWPAFPDTTAALQRLKKNHRLVIVSNVDRASFLLTQKRLGAEFDAVVTAEDVQTYKPATAHFTRALEIAAGWGVARSEVLHVAQSLYHDHAPALALGFQTVWINRRRGKSGTGATPTTDAPVKPTWEAPDMTTLAEMLDR